MIYLILAILSSASIAVLMRQSNQKVSGGTGMVAVNYLMCLVLSAAFAGVDNLLPRTASLGQTLGLGAVNGLLYLMGFVMLQVSIRKNGVVLSTIFMKLGLLVPMVLAVVAFGEKPEMLQIFGFFLALAAILVINYEKTGEKSKSAGYLVLLILLGGGGDAMSKVFEAVGDSAMEDCFLLYTFASALILCLLLVLLQKQKIGKWEWLYGMLIGVPNFFCARFLLKSLSDVPATIAYPTFSVATLLTVTLAGVVLYRERLKKKQWIGVVMILGALILLNI
jgi:drug/metabolite transporter (DMT)-like permease